MKFEYLIIDGYLEVLLSSKSTEKLDSLGALGWELISELIVPSMNTNKMGSFRQTFKRQIP